MVAVGTLQCSCFCQLLSQLPLQTSVQVLVALLHTAGVRVNSIVQNDLCYGSYCAHYITKLMPVTFVKLSLYTIRQKCSINNRTSSTLTPYKAHQQRQQHPAVKPTLIVGYCGGGQFKFQIQQKGTLSCWKSDQILVWDATLPPPACIHLYTRDAGTDAGQSEQRRRLN